MSTVFKRIQDGERIQKNPQLVDDFFTQYQLNSIKAYFKGEDSLESAQASWRILRDDGFTAFQLSQKVARPMAQLREVMGL
ncbi:hypothetical protein P7F88_25190 [Vibrio hannami]|uniref:hypothetical protein n=1 Tax=Vibrio hannami TaxID=2717094 RepID=UPI002410140F|nr:hypothetical protein [Vibrio hannami]MDG3089160.1 hypothetical protein [Vibrio hannami]